MCVVHEVAFHVGVTDHTSRYVTAMPPLIEGSSIATILLPNPKEGAIRWKRATIETLNRIDCAIVPIDPKPAGAQLIAYLLGRHVPILVVAGDNGSIGEHHGSLEFASAHDEEAPQRYLLRQWERTIREKRTQRARALAEQSGYSVNALGMIHACEHDDVPVVQCLLNVGVSGNVTDHRGVPALIIAIRNGAWRAVELLSESTIDVDAIAADSRCTALVELAALRQPTLVKHLLTAGAAVDHVSTSGQTALMIAVGIKDLPTAKVLINHGADPDRTDALGVSARRYAALLGLEGLFS